MTKLNYKELINLKLSVPCSTWKKKDAVQLFGADYVDKNTDGSIEKCYYGRDTRPLFQIYFPALDATINKIELDYVFRYCNEVPGPTSLVPETRNRRSNCHNPTKKERAARNRVLYLFQQLPRKNLAHTKQKGRAASNFKFSK